MFIDLEKTFTLHGVTDIKSRVETIRKDLPEISLCALGGIPIKTKDGSFFLLDKKIDEATLRDVMVECLGLSGMLTYANRSNLTLYEMGLKCKSLEHNWGLNFMTLTLLFNGLHQNVEKSLLRDKNFYESWVVGDDTIFAITGTIKAWKKFVSNKVDKTFDVETRNALNIIDKQFNYIWI